MSTLDLEASTRAMATLVGGIRDDQLGSPTPCPAYTVGDLVEHVGGAARAFIQSARKQPLGEQRGGDGSRLEEGWRERIRTDLVELAAAWREPGAMEGSTMAGPIELPAPAAASVILDELVVHGWDIARSTGQEYVVDPADTEAARTFVAQFDAPADDGGLFGPPVAVPDDASPLDRLVAMTGRDPGWKP